MLELDPTLKTRIGRYLTSDVLDKLPNQNAIIQASQRLSSLHKTISSFLPLYIVENEQRLSQDYSNLSPGTFMFADVSGFTALNEKLMRQAGAEGTEILTRVFNDYFATMLEILAKSDGQLLKFAGDALLTFFPEVRGIDERPKAVNAALRMQRAMIERFQPIQDDNLKKWFGRDHNLELTMSIGISKGKLFESLVGNISQRDHMIMGRLPGQADAAEEAGVRDDVIVDAPFQQVLQEKYSDIFETINLGNDFYEVRAKVDDRKLGDYEVSMPKRRRAKSSFLFSFDDKNIVENLEDELSRVEVISRYVSSEIVNKLVFQGDHIQSENRLATVIFVHFTGFAELLEAWGEDKLGYVTPILNSYYSTMQRTIAKHGGVLTRSDPYKLGSKLLITFGAPVAHPDDPDRAVTTALEMNKQLEIINQRLKDQLEDVVPYPYIQQRIGITQGEVFAGEVGWRQRREYTVMGDDVNLAARLMSKAQFGEILISETVYDRVKGYFETIPKTPFEVKGKSRLIQAYSAVRVRKEAIAYTSDTPFVGRKLILMTLNLSLQQALHAPQQLRAVGLHGDIGVGKTRLAKKFAQDAKNYGVKVGWATSRNENDRKTTWARLIRQIMPFEHASDEKEKKSILQELLADLNLSNLEDVFEDLLFATEEARLRDTKSQNRSSSKARTDLFAKLSSENTLAMKQDEMAQFRKQMKQRFNTNKSNSELPTWSELDMQTSLTDALSQFLEVYTEDQPVLLIIDDIQKENQRALNILKKVLEQTQGARAMILIMYEPTNDPQVNINKIAVPDLPEEETYLMASAILNTPEIGKRLSQFLWESSNGRTMYIESLIQTLIDTDQLETVQGVTELKPDANIDSLPDDVRGLVISRIDRLSSEARLAVRGAAVFGNNFTIQAIKVICEIESDRVIKKIFDDLLAFQIFSQEEDGTYIFQHGVTQQAVYDELAREQRQALHDGVVTFYCQKIGIEEVGNTIVYHLVRGGDLYNVAGAAATMGQYVNKNILRDVTKTSRFSKTFDKLVELGFFRATNSNFYQFNSSNFQDMLYDQMSRIDRQNWHLAFAEYYRQSPRNLENIIQTASHSKRAGNPTGSYAELMKTVDMFVEDGQFEMAIRIYEKALTIFNNDEDIHRNIIQLRDYLNKNS